MRTATFAWLIAGVLLFAASDSGAGPQTVASSRLEQNIQREVRHELALLPYLSVFDNLEYRVDGTHVVLTGQVANPVLKPDAEAAVKKIEGVEGVDNQIEVLPTSPDDDQIRRAEFRAIYLQGGLQRYAEGAMAAIHIIVKNGRVTLDGAVETQSDKNLAGIEANTVPNVFEVTNNLAVLSTK